MACRSHNFKRVQNMRLLERELSELHTKIKLYTGMYQKSSSKIEALKRHYEGLHGDQHIPLLDEDVEYQRALERIRTARRRLEMLENERREILKRFNTPCIGFNGADRPTLAATCKGRWCGSCSSP